MKAIKRMIIPVSLLVLDLVYFFSKYPNFRERYAGYVNWRDGTLYLLTNEILDFRFMAFLLIIFIPAILIPWIFVSSGLYDWIFNKFDKKDNKSFR